MAWDMADLNNVQTPPPPPPQHTQNHNSRFLIKKQAKNVPQLKKDIKPIAM